MIEEMKIYFKGNDLKIKKVLENSESYSDDAKKMRILLEIGGHQTRLKTVQILVTKKTF